MTFELLITIDLDIWHAGPSWH